MKNKKTDKTNKRSDFLKYSSLGFEMMAIIAGFTFLGYKIDYWMKNEFKGFMLVFMVLSVIGSIIYGTRSLLKKPDDGE